MEIVDREFEQLGKYLPLISIIVPCYNSALFISETLDSVKAQHYENWECIVVDDNSIDESLSVINRYCDSDNRIKLFSNPRQGACSARNYGIEQSSGIYIKFLDSDDIIDNPSVLLEQKQYIESSGKDIVYGVEQFYNDKFENEFLVKTRGGFITERSVRTLFENFPITSNFLIRRSILSDIRWNERLKSGQEFFLLFQCYLSRATFGYQDIKAVKVRIHDSIYRISNKPKSKSADEGLDLVEEMAAAIKKHGNVGNNVIYELKKNALVKSYQAIKAKNFNAAKRLQYVMNNQFCKIEDDFKVRFVFGLNSVSTYLGYFGYRIVTFITAEF